MHLPLCIEGSAYASAYVIGQGDSPCDVVLLIVLIVSRGPCVPANSTLAVPDALLTHCNADLTARAPQATPQASASLTLTSSTASTTSTQVRDACLVLLQVCLPRLLLQWVQCALQQEREYGDGAQQEAGRPGPPQSLLS